MKIASKIVIDFLPKMCYSSCMDTETLSCMESAGLITESQRGAMAKASRLIPQSEGGMLSLLAVMAIVGQDASSFQGAPVGSESITSTGLADVKSLTVPAGATRAIISVHVNNIIFRVDAGAPSVGNGHTSEVNSNFSIGALSEFRFISAIAGSATIFVSYF